MRLGTLYEPEDEPNGGWTREQLEAMDALFVAALEKAFESGLESRASASGQVKLPVGLGPRFVTALCQATRDGLFRSAATDSTVFVARG
jgi:hypothetical protein